MEIDPRIAAISMPEGRHLATSTMTDEMAPGPASMEFQRHDYRIFFRPWLLGVAVGLSSARFEHVQADHQRTGSGNFKAGKGMPNMRKMSCPAMAKLVSTMSK